MLHIQHIPNETPDVNPVERKFLSESQDINQDPKTFVRTSERFVQMKN